MTRSCDEHDPVWQVTDSIAFVDMVHGCAAACQHRVLHAAAKPRASRCLNSVTLRCVRRSLDSSPTFARVGPRSTVRLSDSPKL